MRRKFGLDFIRYVISQFDKKSWPAAFSVVFQKTKGKLVSLRLDDLHEVNQPINRQKMANDMQAIVIKAVQGIGYLSAFILSLVSCVLKYNLYFLMILSISLSSSSITICIFGRFCLYCPFVNFCRSAWPCMFCSCPLDLSCHFWQLHSFCGFLFTSLSI